ncbi:MAG TPA: PQQ-binding-like beta-propeller repeat protein [Vicinamibacterales bacterium]|nr:PQQ-binding-like beta-propeller repeat protein [Vicinamibacterales bacterium]
MQFPTKQLVIVAASTFVLGVAVVAQNGRTSSADNDWPMYSRDFTGSRYSPLADINTGNVAQLTQAWSVQLTTPAGRRGGGPPPAATPPTDGAASGQAQGRGGAGGRGAGGSNAGGEGDEGASTSNPQVTPIVVNGVMYLPARGNQVLALDADTGKEIWRYQMPKDVTSDARGTAYWPGESGLGPRILLTAGPRLIALDAATGRPAAGFGRDGMVEIQVPWRGVPVIYKHIAILGAYPGEVPLGPTGDTRAFDVRTGKKLWQFATVPLPGQPGHETWLDFGWRDRSGTNVWAYYMTIDTERGILYMPVSSPAANYWGGDRPGANLFGNSIVAVDAETGKYRWHFQTVHHDLWDFDMPSPPVLVDITQNGRRIPALASIGKTGYMFILDRVTGKPIFGVEERPVPKGSVPDEWYSPTQPFPVKPARPFARVEFVKERDFVRPEDTTPQHVAECQALWDKSGGFHNAGPFTPWLYREEGAPPRSSVQFPGAGGGVNWGGPAADPRSGMVFMNAHDSSLVGYIERKKPGLNYGRNTEGSTQPLDRASVNGPGPYFNFTAPLKDETGRTVGNLPCWRPPWARLVAVNVNTGDVAWEVPLGMNEALPEGKRLTGNSGSAGPSVTAGGLVFVGATSDRRLRAFDMKTGKELWSTRLGAQVNANPMTYRGKSGKQYIAAVATDSLVAFALP